MALPPNYTKAKFMEAMADLASILGKEYIHINDGALNDGNYYHIALSHDAYHAFDPEEFMSSAIVCPANTEEVQAVVKWANKWIIPIWPISIGRNVS